ncbi:MAG: hypothetical protein SGJ18_05455 [Pseudomonadota bacterium]|nr:hypothetical protein [Pseudomonadota bacterium]
MTSHETIIECAKRLIERNELARAIRLLNKAAKWFPREVNIWRLLGVAQGSSGNHLGARAAFLEAVDLNLADIDVANLITTFWPTDEAKQGIEILESQFESLSPAAKEIAINSVCEAMRVGVLQFDWLPSVVQQHYVTVYGKP